MGFNEDDALDIMSLVSYCHRRLYRIFFRYCGDALFGHITKSILNSSFTISLQFMVIV